MMFTEVTGNILDVSDVKVPTYICHQVNCQGKFNAGLARQIMDKFPQAYKDYVNRYKGMKLGNVLISPINDLVHIVHIFGQNQFGRDRQYTDYGALLNAFSILFTLRNDKTIRVPYKLGCGLGGGDCNKVKQIILNEAGWAGFQGHLQIWKLPKKGGV